MGEIIERPPVKLIIGYIYKDENIYHNLHNRLEELYDEMNFISEKILFEHTQYYYKEMGNPLWRRFSSFKKLINSEQLPDIKITTNDLEMEYTFKENDIIHRRINLDPGYISVAKLILATTKNQQHRIYLAKGIFGDMELYYKDKSFTYWQWTYPDYRTEEYITIFNKIRQMYAKQIKDLGMRFI